MINQKTPNLSEIRKAVGERVNARLPSVLFKALVHQHERYGFRTGCTCKYCNEKRIVSNLKGFSIPHEYRDTHAYNKFAERTRYFQDLARKRLREVSEKELDDFT